MKYFILAIAFVLIACGTTPPTPPVPTPQPTATSTFDCKAAEVQTCNKECGSDATCQGNCTKVWDQTCCRQFNQGCGQSINREMYRTAPRGDGYTAIVLGAHGWEECDECAMYSIPW